MPKKVTAEGFIKRAREMHQDRYDYSAVSYINTATKIIIICPIHGNFLQTPSKHMLGRGCPECSGNVKGDIDSFIQKAQAVHGDRYDYSQVVYKGNKKAVVILCRKHGDFFQTPSDHTNQKSGCPACKGEKSSILQTKSQDQFLTDAHKVHGEKFDYSQVEYKKSNQKVLIKCLEHGVFEQAPGSHLSGRGCPKCGDKITAEKATKSNSQFLEDAKKVHRKKYDYSKTVYAKAKDEIIVTCRKHGDFAQIAAGHLIGRGCPICAIEERANKQRKTVAQFIVDAKAVHGNRYGYTEVDYVNTNTPVLIICSEHGRFYQAPQSHLTGCGCNKCGHLSATLKQAKTNDEFIEEAIALHGDRYRYSDTSYVNSRIPVVIHCPMHGSFAQEPSAHLSGSGCPQCGFISSNNARRLSISEFINKAHQIHNKKYDYSRSIYVSSHIKIDICCDIHGVFIQTPNSHLNGAGCPKCGVALNAAKLTLSIGEFIKRATEMHGDTYDYSLSNYVSSKDKIKIICSKHGIFEQIPSAHMAGRGCMKCGDEERGLAQRRTHEEFLQESFEVHGERYDYSLAEYKNAHDRVTIICTEHGEFSQIPRLHLNGAGCPKCNYGSGVGTYDASYFERYPEQRESPCTFYYIKFTMGNKAYFKVGMDSTGKRWRDVYKGWEVTTIQTIATTKYNAWLLETSILEENIKYRYRVREDVFKGNGSTEMFTFDILMLDS